VVRNYQSFDRLVLVSDSDLLRVCVGAGPGADGSPRPESELLSAAAQATGEPQPALKARLEALPQKERYIELGKIAWDSMRTDATGFVNQRLTAFVGFWLGDDWLKHRRMWREEPAAGAQPLPGWFAPTFAGSVAVMLLLALLGWRWSFARRGPAPITLTPILVALPYVLTHAEPLAGPRLPLDGLLLSLAAFAVAGLLPRVGPLPALHDEADMPVSHGPAPVAPPVSPSRPAPPPPPKPPPPPPRAGGGGYTIRP
jgi:hypothetical protein